MEIAQSCTKPVNLPNAVVFRYGTSNTFQKFSQHTLLTTLWPSDIIWQHWPGSTLAQAMACCLMAPSHYLNQCLLITLYQWGPVTFIWGQFRKIPQPSITKISLKISQGPMSKQACHHYMRESWGSFTHKIPGACFNITTQVTLRLCKVSEARGQTVLRFPIIRKDGRWLSSNHMIFDNMTLEQNDHHFVHNVFKWISLYENQVKSHYLNQWRSSSMTSYGDTCLQ